MKRILIMDTGSFKVFGGAAKTAYDTYLYLKKNGYSVDIFGDFSKIDKNLKPKDAIELRPDYYDAVFLNSIRDVPVVKSNLDPLNSETRFIYTDRGNVINNFKNAGAKRLLPKMIARQLLANEMRKWLDCYVALTAEQEELARSFFGKKTEIKFIPNWYSEEFRPLKVKKSSAAIYVGRLDERQKKVRFLIEEIGKFVNKNTQVKGKVVLRIVGSGPDEERYKALVNRKGLGHNVEFYSFVKQENLVKLYNESLFFVSTSEWEGMAGTFVEAMACGLPLLINERNNTLLSRSPIRTLVMDRKNGLIYKYGDIDDFADKFQSLYSNSGLRRKLSVNSVIFSKNFRMELNLDKYRKLVG